MTPEEQAQLIVVGQAQAIAAQSALSDTAVSEMASDEEIIGRAVELLKQGKDDSETKACLIDEYDGLEPDVDLLIKQAHTDLAIYLRKQEDEAEHVKGYEDGLIKTAFDATDKFLQQEYERKKLWTDNYLLRNKIGQLGPEANVEQLYAYYKQMDEDQQEPEERFEDSAHEPFPECPIFPGALTDLARAMYPSLPIEFKQWGLITRFGLLRSGIDYIEAEPHLQPRFYTVLVADANRGKTASINESRTAMEMIVNLAKVAHAKLNNISPVARVFANVECLTSVDSGPFLASEFYDLAKESNKQFASSVIAEDRAKILMDPDELSDVFEKGRSSTGRVSTLFIELLKLHSQNRTGSGTKTDGKRPVENAHLAILGGTTTQKYPMLWTGTGGGADGLVSRVLIITTNAPPVPPVPLGTDTVAMNAAYQRLSKMALMPPQKIRFSDEAAELLSDWWSSFDNRKQSAARILEAVKQLIIVLAVTNVPDDYNGTEITVGPELVQHGIEFGTYEIAIRERLNPGDASSLVQAHEQVILRWAQKHTSKKNPKSRNECRRDITPHKLPGGVGTFLLAWRNMVQSEYLKLRDKNGKALRYSL